MTDSSPQPASAKALLPLALFLVLFLGTGLYFQNEGVEYAFYQLPSPVAILPAIVLGILLSKQAFEERINTFVAGVGDNNIITMCVIYLLAGAFSTVAEATGGVDAMVALGLSIIPAAFLLPGLFIIAGVISTAMGTSMGTLAALAPVVLGIGEATDISLPLLAGVLVSGAMFGDNLSIISDTTIAATRTQGCTMRDKFRANLKIAIPAAIITILWLVTYDTSEAPLKIPDANLWLSLPYFAIIVLAVMGLNVFAVLGLGIVLAAAFGMFTVDYEWVAFSQDIYKGFESMQEIFLLSLLIGGLSALIRQQGGLAFLAQFVEAAANKVSKHKQRASAIGIAGLTALTNLCVANNTVSILLAGEVSKRLAKIGNLAPRQSASLLDIFACVVQGALPYGAQALLMGASFKISPLSVSIHTGYSFILAAVAIAIIIWRRPLEDREPAPESV
ncbi:Na+/H+ antiporter NhaC family protein [Idiomarina sp. UBA4520]|jgi:Na+/H+ antiporter NhaC|uniref:Na+/H+ antiporter NhaC family protein n=1 Tax=Idiomarina sp. UBA4520 TaxID=1946647 RepID=UPI000B0AA76D|nr:MULTISPECIES: Na+/H+ antiporter NhaC family protein [unclassified Idiomarina]MBF38236.1 sodium:proton antiporter [Idiomarinaceae bacterium]MCH2454883.1 Na+/H+ antiporter NhaC family protein [Idiomarina sp.]|tara:strand:- start:93810 stop:95150 length:1341 start_codon:yes stop_codon:yes gene_type:complete